MVHRVLIASHAPLQRTTGSRGSKTQTIVDAGLDLRAFLIIVPGYELQRRQLFSRVIQAVDFRKRLQPGLSALLAHDAV